MNETIKRIISIAISWLCIGFIFGFFAGLAVCLNQGRSDPDAAGLHRESHTISHRAAENYRNTIKQLESALASQPERIREVEKIVTRIEYRELQIAAIADSVETSVQNLDGSLESALESITEAKRLLDLGRDN